jgi:hypothetical protein
MPEAEVAQRQAKLAHYARRLQFDADNELARTKSTAPEEYDALHYLLWEMKRGRVLKGQS